MDEIDELVEEKVTEVLCSICGKNHMSFDCDFVPITSLVPNKIVLTRARLTLPDFLQISDLSDGSRSVITKEEISKGSRFGPLEAKKSITLIPVIHFPLKVFPYEKDDFLEYYLDTTDENLSSWMIFVEPATNLSEQNLICYQEGEHIYYLALRDINKDEVLKVWYAPYYAKKMNKDIFEEVLEPEQEAPSGGVFKKADLNEILKKQRVLDRDSWTCKFCSAICAEPTLFASHMLEHYLAQLKKVCEICKETFRSVKALKKHINIVHPKNLNGSNNIFTKDTFKDVENGDRNDKSGKENFFKTGSKDFLSDPLLNSLGHDTFESSTLLVTNSDINNFALGGQEILLDTENLNDYNLITDNVRALDHFNFELGECQEEFVCDLCLKSFNKLRNMVHHLEGHTASFFCQICSKVFLRKESLKHHSCQGSKNYICKICESSFAQEKYYNRHMSAVHEKKIHCFLCDKYFGTKSLMDNHNCSAIPEEQKKKYSCSLCRKTFNAELYYKRHLARHADTSESDDSTYICPICARIFKRNAYHLHMQKHKEATFECETCKKKFFRKDVYLGHLKTHTVKTIKCPECDKPFRTEKSLYMHQMSHSEEAKFQCPNCDMSFRQKSNFSKHLRIHTKNVKSIVSDVNQCPYCPKSMKLRSSLTRHVRKAHTKVEFEIFLEERKKIANRPLEIFADTYNDDFGCENVDSGGENTDSRDKNIEQALKDSNTKDNLDIIKEAEMCINDIANSFQIELIDNLVDCTTRAMGLGINDGLILMDDDPNLQNSLLLSPLANREVCLSMPDLNDTDREITLNQNVYMSTNNNEPSNENSDVVVFVLNQSA